MNWRKVNITAYRSGEAGFTLVELIAAITIMLILTAVALPLARVQIQRRQEAALRRDLRELRQAIDRYKDFADRGMIPTNADSFGYPPDLETLVKGVPLKGGSNGQIQVPAPHPCD